MGCIYTGTLVHRYTIMCVYTGARGEKRPPSNGPSLKVIITLQSCVSRVISLNHHCVVLKYYIVRHSHETERVYYILGTRKRTRFVVIIIIILKQVPTYKFVFSPVPVSKTHFTSDKTIITPSRERFFIICYNKMFVQILLTSLTCWIMFFIIKYLLYRVPKDIQDIIYLPSHFFYSLIFYQSLKYQGIKYNMRYILLQLY